MTEREIRREVERAFYGYNELKQKAAEYIADAATNNLGVDYSRVRVCGSGTDADGSIVTALDRNQRNYLWCRVVELTKERYAADSDNAMLIREYFKGKRQDRRQRLQYLCSELYMSEEKAYRQLREILNYGALVALQFNLISVIDSNKI